MRLATSMLPVLALLSGAAALLYETVWLRWFGLLFGNTAYAASATLCAFFAGLGLGAALFGRWAGHTRRPLLFYAGIEVGAAVAALLVPFLVAAYDPAYAALYARLAESRALFVAVKFTLALVAIVPAAALLGGALPMLAAAFVLDVNQMGRCGGFLYAVHTLGAVLGSAAGALWLPERIGVGATYGVAIALSLGIGVLASALARTQSPLEARPERPEVSRAAAPPGLLAIAFASGVGTLAFEVLLIHGIALTLRNSVYSFGAVFIVVLLALAAGAALVASIARRFAARALLPGALVAEAIALLTLPWLMVRATGQLHAVATATFSNGLALAAVFGGPAFLIAGLVLPLTFRFAEGGAVGPRMGGLLAANTIGGIAGSALAGFVLLEGLGLWASMAALGLGYGAVAVFCEGSALGRAGRCAVVATVAVAVFAGGANPLELPTTKLGKNERLVAVAEGAHGIVSVTEVLTRRLQVDRRLKVDNQYILSAALAQTHQERMGHLPLMLHPDPKRVIYVGSATGETASAALLHPVDEIVLVEIVPEVQKLASRYFSDVNRGVYDNRRTRVVVEDGRNHLRAAPETYDVIVADLFAPRRPGVGAMYSLEHFQAVKRHLAPRGVFCQWLPVYQLDEENFRVIAATFLEVFPHATLWRGDFFARRPTAALVAFADAPPDVAEVEAAARRLRERGVEDRWITDPRGLWMLYVGPLSGALDLGDAPINTDEWPVFEYMAGRSRESDLAAFRETVWPAIANRAIEAAGGSDPAFLGRPFHRTRAAATFARAIAMVSTEGRVRLREAIALARASVPEDLLDPPDGSVAEVWPTGAARGRVAAEARP